MINSREIAILRQMRMIATPSLKWIAHILVWGLKDVFAQLPLLFEIACFAPDLKSTKSK